MRRTGISPTVWRWQARYLEAGVAVGARAGEGHGRSSTATRILSIVWARALVEASRSPTTRRSRETRWCSRPATGPRGLRRNDGGTCIATEVLRTTRWIIAPPRAFAELSERFFAEITRKRIRRGVFKSRRVGAGRFPTIWTVCAKRPRTSPDPKFLAPYDYVRFSGYENTSMHMAVSRGSGAIGTADRGPEHAAEARGSCFCRRGMRHHGDHAAHLKADGVALAGALPGGRGRWPVARQEPAAGDERRHQDAGG